MSQEVAQDNIEDRQSAPLWRNVNFTLMWSSVAASGFGDRLIMLIALTLMKVNSFPGEKASFQAGVGFWFFLPYLIVGPGAGWLADTLPRKWILLACDEIRALLLGLGFLLVADAAAGPGGETWQVYGIIAAVGMFAAISNPARNAMVPQIVPLRQLQASNALIVGIATIASLLGVIAGKLLKEDDPATIRDSLKIAILFYAISGSFYAFVRVRKKVVVEQSSDTGWQRMFSALSYIKQHNRVFALIMGNLLVWGAAMVVYNAIIALVSELYGFGDSEQEWAGYLNMVLALGAGSLCGALFVAWMNTRRQSSIVALLGLMMSGLCTLALAMIPVYWIGMVLVFGVSFFGFMAVICLVTLLQGIMPNYMRGRVMGINLFMNTLSNVLVNLAIWQLPNADKYMRGTLCVTAAVMIGVSVFGLRKHVILKPLANRWANVFWHLTRIFSLVWHRVRWIEKQRVPMEGPVILASNHTAGIDPFLIQSAVLRMVRWMMVGNYKFKILEPMWKAIDPIVLDDNDGRQALKQIRKFIEVLKNDQIVGIFPEGGLQRDHRDLQKFQVGIGMIAKRTNAWIVPVWLKGTPVRKNMIWHFLEPCKSTVIFGEPYKADQNMSNEEVAEDLRQRMIALAKMYEGDER